MVRLYGRLSVNGPVAVNRYRQKYGGDGVGGSGCGGGCEIIVTPNPTPGRLSVVVVAASAPIAPIADNTMKAAAAAPPSLQPTHIAINENQQVRSLGKLLYTTKAGDTFTAYHSTVFPKIVNESDKIVYDNKERWYEAMRVVAPVRCD